MKRSFLGSVTLFSNKEGMLGPKVQDGVVFALELGVDDEALTVPSFNAVIVDDIDSPVGDLQLTVTMIGTGSGSLVQASGAVSIDVVFRFKFNSLLAPPSKLRLQLGTGHAQMPAGDTQSGEPLAAGNGKLKLVGASPFENGALDKVLCGVILEGTLDPPLF